MCCPGLFFIFWSLEGKNVLFGVVLRCRLLEILH
jgi:hypothetical protein